MFPSHEEVFMLMVMIRPSRQSPLSPLAQSRAVWPGLPLATAVPSPVQPRAIGHWAKAKKLGTEKTATSNLSLVKVVLNISSPENPWCWNIYLH